MDAPTQRSERVDDDHDTPHVNRRRHAQVAEKKEFGAEYAFFCMLSRKNGFRKRFIHVASHKHFEIVIVIAIIANSVILGLSDFTVVDSDLNPASSGLRYQNGVMVSAHSYRNRLLELSEVPFTTIFTAECVIKIIAMGFVSGKGSYLRDSWNLLDFVVVISSIVASLPGMPNVSAIRTIRVLRPLRSLSVIPGMRRLITALLKALPALGNVVILQIFVFFIFGILGIQLFGGGMNRRCRLTEFPVKLPPNNTGSTVEWPIPDEYLTQVLANPDDFRCLDAPVLEYHDNRTSMFTKETSPWNKPQDCFWPVDDSDQQLCAAPGQSGNHQCSSETTCGSNYDAFGNARFKYHKAMDYALYDVDLNWGYTQFDDIGGAFLTIFQSITQEGWTLIMYMVMDSSQPVIGSLFFVVLIIFASFFVMNLTLAVITEKFSIDDDGSGPTAAEKKELLLKTEAAKLSIKPRLPWLFKIVSHPYFSNLVMLVILGNTVVLALDHYPMPPQLDSDLEIVNFGLSCFFILEMIIKLIGLGLRQYSRDRFNVFDAFIVTTGVLELIASPPSFLSDNPPKKGAVSALRSLRLFRIFKLARDWRDLRELLAMIAGAVASIGNFGVLLFLFIYIYALVGLQVPRNNFDTLLWSMVTVFQVITGENWNNIMYDTMRGNGMVACIYFISLVIFGNFVLMNLFLALLLDNFSLDDEDEEKVKEKQEDMKILAQKMSSMKVAPLPADEKRRSRLSFRESVNTLEHPFADTKAIFEDDEEEEENVHNVDLDQLSKELDPRAYLPPKSKIARSDIIKPPDSKQSNPSVRAPSKNQVVEMDSMPPKRESKLAINNADDSPSEDPFLLLPPKGRTLFLFSEKSWLRRASYRLISHPLFDKTILVLIVLSSISLAVDNPLYDPASDLSKFLKRMDNAFAIIFCAEMVVKIIALGLVIHKDAYLRNSWNILDCGIVVTSMIMLIAESSGGGKKGLKSLRSLRGLRTFRPLRMISRRPGLKLVVNALIESIPRVVNVLLVCMMFFFIFSIVAVNYLKGTFYSCQGDVFDGLSPDQQSFLVSPVTWDNTTAEQQSWFVNTTCTGFTTSTASKITSRYICECWGAEWGKVMAENFDHVGKAMLTFYEISTTEGWSDVMMAAIDSTDIDMQPIRDNNENWAYFFLAFIMVGHFFAVNLFVGVIIDNFNRMKAALGGDFMLTPEQRKWIEAQKAARRVGPIRITKPPKHPTRRMFFDLVKNPKFEWAIMGCIIVNTLLMATQYFGEATIQLTVVNILNEIFAAVFALEAAMKLIAFGWEYFNENWNCFDFFVVCGTFGSVLIEAITGTSVRSIAMLVRVFRVTRIIRLVKASKSIRQILLTLYIALPGLSNVASILFLMLFIYATMGVQMFAKVAFSDNIDSHANFQDFFTAVLFLFRAATGEAWDYCMHDLASRTDGCVDDPDYDPNMCGFNNFEGCIPLNGCGNSLAFVYFCSFTLLVTYVMLNLTIAVILESFSQSQEDDEALIEPELLEEFQFKWADIDKKARGLVRVTKLMTLVSILDPPLGKHGVNLSKSDFLRYMRGLDVPLYEGETVHFKDVLLSMAREMVKESLAESGDPNEISKIAPPAEEEYDVPPMDFYAQEYFAVVLIQRSVAAWLRIKRELEKQYMEEYKNKIKKPSGRPKKVRDARVYTIG